MADRMLDIHQHIVYGMDDGAQTKEDSLRMLRQAQQDGIAYILGTSHAIPSMKPFPLERYYRHLDTINGLAQANGIPVTVYQGCEIFFGDGAIRQLQAGELPTLAGTKYVLIEFDPSLSAEAMVQALRQMGNAGYVPVVAHVERYPALVRRPEALLEAAGQFPIRVQMNGATVIERCPRPVRKFCDLLFQEDAVDFLATDAHDTEGRPVNLRQAYEVVAKKYGEERARALTKGQRWESFHR